jgi:hypothetical protein
MACIVRCAVALGRSSTNREARVSAASWAERRRRALASGLSSLDVGEKVLMSVVLAQAFFIHDSARCVTAGRSEHGRLFHQLRFGDEWHDVLEFTGVLTSAVSSSLARYAL